VSFKKTKLTSHDSSSSSSRLLDLRSAYELAKKRNIISAIILTFLAVLLLSFGAMMSLEKIGNFQFDFSFLGKLNPVTMITGETQPEKINFLLAGIGGGVHDGPQLTDTIMLASINTRLKTVSLLSIPRDLYVEYPDGGAGRINELYGRGIKAYGQARGIKMLQDKVSEITGEAIDHFLVVDFAGFTKFVDLLDGLEVTVPDDLVDTEYPNEADWTYTTFSIKK
jgi:LCP family protein required for cell wall assembly